jgi:hypothetical protein
MNYTFFFRVSVWFLPLAAVCVSRVITIIFTDVSRKDFSSNLQLLRIVKVKSKNKKTKCSNKVLSSCAHFPPKYSRFQQQKKKKVQPNSPVCERKILP